MSYRTYIERRDAARNMARFYAISREGDLFGGTVLVRRWGRIGTFARIAKDHFHCEDDALLEVLTLLRSKQLRGYRAPGEHPVLQ